MGWFKAVFNSVHLNGGDLGVYATITIEGSDDGLRADADGPTSWRLAPTTSLSVCEKRCCRENDDAKNEKTHGSQHRRPLDPLFLLRQWAEILGVLLFKGCTDCDA